MKKILSVLLFVFVCTLDAAETVSGIVYDAVTGKPAAGVTVGLHELNMVTETDARGEFSFTGIEKGYYELTFSHQDYGNISIDIRVKRNFRIVKNLLPKAFDAGNRTKVYGEYLHIDNLVSEWFMLGWSASYVGNDRVWTGFVTSVEAKERNDCGITQRLQDLMEAAEIIAGHNIDGFDIKKCNTVFMRHGLSPITGKKTIDTLKLAR